VYETVFKPGYGDMVWSLSYAYIMGYESIHYDGDEKLYEKYKDADSETVVDRLLYMNSAMEGKDRKIYFDGKAEKLDTMNFTGSLPVWKFSDGWIGNGDYITVQKLEPEFAKRKYDWEEWKYVDVIVPPDLNVVYLDYTMPIADVHKYLKHAKRHYGYPGSTSHLAGLVGTPYTVFAKDADQGRKRHPKGDVYYINKDMIDLGDLNAKPI